MKRRGFISGIGACLTGASLKVNPAYGALNEKWWHRAQPMMGTVVSIAIYGAQRQDPLFDGCFEAMNKVVQEISDWEANSVISCLNEERVIYIDEFTSASPLLNIAEEIKDISSGAFNICCRNLTRAWRGARNSGVILSPNEKKSLIKDVSSTRLIKDNTRIKLIGSEKIDLGGIGKGFVADCGIEFLKSKGVSFARIAASGDLRFLGNTNWVVEVEDPDGGNGKEIEIYGSCAVSSSGNYRDFDIINGQKCHHLIDLKSGVSKSSINQITVVHEIGAWADGLATATYLMGKIPSLNTAQFFIT